MTETETPTTLVRWIRQQVSDPSGQRDWALTVVAWGNIINNNNNNRLTV